jgi:hypothetical protein
VREWKTRDIDKKIRDKMPAVNRSLIGARRGKVVRRRPRDKGEQDILDLFCKRKWEDDLARGKVRIINRREWYCEFD